MRGLGLWTGGGEVPAAPQELEATVADAEGERRSEDLPRIV